MRASYGYDDGSGSYLITIDTDRCTGCEACVDVCPAAVLAMEEEEPIEARLVAAVAAEQRKQLKYACGPCKPTGYTMLPCVAACEPDAIEHSW